MVEDYSSSRAATEGASNGEPKMIEEVFVEIDRGGQTSRDILPGARLADFRHNV